MNWASALGWGFFATLALTTIQTGAQRIRVSRMSMPLMLGTIVSGQWNRARIWGFALHFLLGWAFTVLYAWVFEALGFATWWLGGLGGFFHAGFMLVVAIPLLPTVHPRMASESRQPDPTPLLEPPGFLALNYGRRTPLVVLASHLAYGVILGSFYSLAG